MRGSVYPGRDRFLVLAHSKAPAFAPRLDASQSGDLVNLRIYETRLCFHISILAHVRLNGFNLHLDQTGRLLNLLTKWDVLPADSILCQMDSYICRFNYSKRALFLLLQVKLV